jgi:hypothetical protein
MTVGGYEGPYCIVALTNDKKHSIRGTREDVTALLRDGAGLVELVDVFGRGVTVNADQVVQIEHTGIYPARRNAA